MLSLTVSKPILFAYDSRENDKPKQQSVLDGVVTIMSGEEEGEQSCTKNFGLPSMTVRGGQGSVV